jgi:hypothetical protein
MSSLIVNEGFKKYLLSRYNEYLQECAEKKEPLSKKRKLVLDDTDDDFKEMEPLSKKQKLVLDDTDDDFNGTEQTYGNFNNRLLPPQRSYNRSKTPRKRRHLLTKQDKETIFFLNKQKKSITKISDQVNSTPSTVSHLLIKNGYRRLITKRTRSLNDVR